MPGGLQTWTELVDEFDEPVEESQVRRGAAPFAEQAQRAEIHAGALEQVERVPGCPGAVVVVDAGVAPEACPPTGGVVDPASTDGAEIGPVLGCVAAVRELPVGEGDHAVPGVQEVPGSRIAVDDAHRA